MRSRFEQQLGARLKALRLNRDLTQEALAERSRLSVDAVRRIERGAFSPTLTTLLKLTDGLAISIETLFQSDGHARRDVAEVCAFLHRRKRHEVCLAWRVLTAIFQ